MLETPLKPTPALLLKLSMSSGLDCAELEVDGDGIIAREKSNAGVVVDRLSPAELDAEAACWPLPNTLLLCS